MSSNLLGALDQYFTIEPKARLHRRNTFFDDVRMTDYNALKVGIVVSTLATAIVVFWSIGVIL